MIDPFVRLSLVLIFLALGAFLVAVTVQGCELRRVNDTLRTQNETLREQTCVLQELDHLLCRVPPTSPSP